MGAESGGMIGREGAVACLSLWDYCTLNILSRPGEAGSAAPYFGQDRSQAVVETSRPLAVTLFLGFCLAAARFKFFLFLFYFYLFFIMYYHDPGTPREIKNHCHSQTHSVSLDITILDTFQVHASSSRFLA